MSDVLGPENLHSLLSLPVNRVNPMCTVPVVRFAVPYPVSVAAHWELGNRIDNSNIRDWTPQQIAQQVLLELDRLRHEINIRDARLLSNQIEIAELRAMEKVHLRDIKLLEDRGL